MVAELDPAVTLIAQRELYVSTEGMEIFHGDACTTLYRLSDAQFDVVVTDAFMILRFRIIWSHRNLRNW